MRRLRAIAIVALIGTFAAPGRTEVPLPAFLQVLGSVTQATRPVADALVIALNLASFKAIEVYTTADGRFTMPSLPAGMYKIIAVKAGFAPATVTLMPTQASHKLTMRLLPEKRTSGSDENQEMWEIRGSLPPDVLRDLDRVLESPAQIAMYEIPRFRGEMVSMTGVAQQTSNPAFAQTALGVQGRIGDSWQLGIKGNLHRVEDTTDDAAFGTPAAQSSVMSMELRSSPTDAYRVASTKSWWRYRDDINTPGDDHQADVTSHNFEWQHGDARVQVRYLAQQNLFRTNDPGSNLIEITGDTPILQTLRNDLGVSLRVRQESVHSAGNDVVRTADLGANASFVLEPAFILHYGMSSRLGLDGSEWAPSTGMEWKFVPDAEFVVTAMHKVLDQQNMSSGLPTIVVWTDDSRVLPRYAYSFGLVAGKDTSNRLTAIASVSATDGPMRMIFTDGFEQFWDGLYLDKGDIRRDLRIAYRRSLGSRIAIDVSASGGSARRASELVPAADKAYITGDLQSTFLPTGTSLAVSYREIHEPQATIGGGNTYRSERVNVRMAQSLHLPLDLKLLLGLELAHTANSPYLLDPLEQNGQARKFLGGLAVNF